MSPIKPIEGQQSLLDEPPVRYCRRCGRLLKTEKSRKDRLGPTCRRKCEAVETTKDTNHTKGD